jgi:molecular chaperone DnaK
MGNETFRFEYGDVTVGPEAISAMILRKLKVDAELFFKGPVTNAVITVPAYFNDSRRKATQDAGMIAGLNVLEIINEPTAATLAYAWTMGQLGLEKSDEQARTVLVYDLGGGTFDVTAVRYQGSEFRVLATDGDVRLGGVDWTKRLADDVAQKFLEQKGPDVRKDAHLLESLVQRCEVAKRSLSGRPRANVRMKIGDKNFIAEVTRDRFEQLTADLLQRTRDTTQTVLEESGLKPGEVDRFILVGGSTRMPSVINMMRELGGKDPYTDLSPDEAVAMGAAIQAAIVQARYKDQGMEVPKELSERLENVKQVNVNSHSLGTLAFNRQTGKEENFVLIKRNTPIPCSTQQRFVTRGPNQQRVRVRILEGDAPDPAACFEIGQCVITELPPNLPDASPVEVTYSFDANGRIHVHARDVAGGREARTQIERATGLKEMEVGKLAGVVSDLSVE